MSSGYPKTLSLLKNSASDQNLSDDPHDNPDNPEDTTEDGELKS